jgi:hypothetical protein
VPREGALGSANPNITRTVPEKTLVNLKFIQPRLIGSDSFAWRSPITKEATNQQRNTEPIRQTNSASLNINARLHITIAPLKG